MLKEEAKEIIELSAACSRLVGYLSALDDSENITASYINRLKEYYIFNLKNAVQTFVDKMEE